jgi:hypothetical protein
VFCSNRDGRSGGGRTSRLYLDAAIRKLHYAGGQLVAFVLALIQGGAVQQAYSGVTGTADPRNAYAASQGGAAGRLPTRCWRKRGIDLL